MPSTRKCLENEINRKLKEFDVSCTYQHYCSTCDKYYKSQGLLRKHSKDVHGKKFKCDTCSKVFSNSRNQKKHAKRHDNLPRPPKVKPEMRCFLCSKQFTRKANLN